MRLFLAPGNFVCGLAGLPEASDHCQILRTFMNTLVWGGLAIAAAMYFAF